MTRQTRHPSEPVTVTVPAWLASLRDRGVRAMVLLILVGLTGFVLVGLAWRGSARTPYVPLQIPYLVSGCLAGLALTGLCLGAWNIQIGRRDDARHRAEVETLVTEALDVIDQIIVPRERP